MTNQPVSSMFLMQFGSNTGYALAPLEQLFFESGVELAGGDPARVHLGYTDFAKGHPRILPEDFENLIEFDFRDTREENIAVLAHYVAARDIRLVVIFDIQPVHALFRHLRRNGVETILSYWGAPMASRASPLKLLLKRIEVLSSRSRLDGLIFESRAMAELAVMGRGVPWKMIDIVPLGVDTELFRSGPSDYVYRALGVPRDKKVVVYAGHMHRRKGVHTLVEAAIELLARRQRHDVFFLLCGDKEGESEEYQRACRAGGVDDRVRFGGYRSDLPQVYPACYCGVIPSSGWDSFPRTAVEMAACGLPVVAARLQGLPEAVLDGETGLLFEPENATELADRLEALLDAPEIARQYGARGRRRCEEELNLAVQRARFLAVLRKRLSSKMRE